MDDASITANEDQPTPLDSAYRQGETDNEIKSQLRRLDRAF